MIHPRIVPGRGRFAGKWFLLHGCFSDGPYDSMTHAERERRELIRNPIPPAVYADYQRRGLGGMATHFLTDDLNAIDPEKLKLGGVEQCPDQSES